MDPPQLVFVSPASCDQGWDVEMYYTEESDVAGKVPSQ